MSYCQFNRQEILRKAKERFSKEKAVEYYLKKQRSNKRKVKKQYKNLSKEEEANIKEYQGNIYQQLTQYKNEALQNK